MFDETYVKSLRKEAAQHRTEAQALKAKLAEYEQAQMTETENGCAARQSKAKAEAQAATERARKAMADAAISRAAGAAGHRPRFVGAAG